MSEEEDIISNLPDPILCHILSFLRTKQSALTSILSNRWKYLWLSVPSLYFKTILPNMDQNFYFNDNVYAVLHSRNSPVKSFRLKLTYDYSQIIYNNGPVYSITKWINFVVQRGVETLDVCLIIANCETVHYLLKLPISIVTCKTLVVLKLYNFHVEKGFSSVALPSLKVLELQQFMFPKFRDFMLFLTACPILEDLIIYDLYCKSEESLTRDEWNSFCLSNLMIAQIDRFHRHLTLKAVQNVPSLRFEIDPMNCRKDFIPTFHNLTQLELDSLNYNWKFLLQVLDHCPKLQKLEIDEADTCEVTWTRKDDRENWVEPDFVPQCLSLHLRTCNLLNFLGLQGEVQLARYILENAKVLQNMRIWNWRRQPKIYKLLSSCPTASPTCELTFTRYSFKKTPKKNNDDDSNDDSDYDSNDYSDSYSDYDNDDDNSDDDNSGDNDESDEDDDS